MSERLETFIAKLKESDYQINNLVSILNEVDTEASQLSKEDKELIAKSPNVLKLLQKIAKFCNNFKE